MKYTPRWLWLAVLCLVLFTIISCGGGALLGWIATSTGALPPFYGTGRTFPTGLLPTPTPLSVQSSANDLEAQIEAVYQRIGPGVVNITNRSFAMDFFMRPTPREGTGSGFFYDSQGHIVTNYHVVQGAEELQVALADGRSLPAELVGVDPSNDLAVIRVNLPPEQIPGVPLGDSSALRVGQFVIAIGNPFGLERTLTVGVVSSLGRIIESPNERFIGEVIQSDAAINPGNSGGPLLNLAGEVIGVNSAILSPSGASAGIGFTIPARTVQRVVPVLIEQGRYPQPALHAQMFDLTPQLAELLRRLTMNVPVERGLLVTEVVPGGAADRAGIRGSREVVRVGNLLVPIGGDIITAINDQPINTLRDMIAYLSTTTEVGQTVQVTLIRDGQTQTLPVVLGTLEE